MATKQYDDFHEMMKELQGLTREQAAGMKISDPALNKELQKIIKKGGEDASYFAIFACFPNEQMAEAFVQENGLQVITYSVSDGFTYSTGWHRSDRERWYFSLKHGDATAFEEDDTEEDDEDSEE